MRRSIASALVLLVALAVVPDAAAYRDSVSMATEAADPVIQPLRPHCATVLGALREAAIVGNHSEQPHVGFEEEWLEHAPECRDLRDEVQHEANLFGAIGHRSVCNTLYGSTCVATNFAECDLGVSVRSGLLFYCIGGLNPDN